MQSLFKIASTSADKISLVLNKPLFPRIVFDSQYNKANAYNLAILASTVYHSKDDIRKALFLGPKSGGRAYPFLEAPNTTTCMMAPSPDSLDQIEASFKFLPGNETNTQYFSLETSEYVLFAFRGTLEKYDLWVSDLNVEKVPYKEGVGKVHRGFYEAFKSIIPDFELALEGLNGRPLVLCGHSLGGALATMAATYARMKYGPKIMLYTFGSPLVGDHEFQSYFTNKMPFTYYRVVNNQDLVSMIPLANQTLHYNLLISALLQPMCLLPATMDPFGKPYCHIGKLVFIRRLAANGCSVEVDRKVPAYLTLRKELVPGDERIKTRDLLEILKTGQIGDHSMSNYVSILASDLRLAIESYLSSGSASVANTEKLIRYLEKEVEELQSAHSKLQSQAFSQVGASMPDASSVSGIAGNRLTIGEKLQLAEEALNAKQAELGKARAQVAAEKSPGYKATLLKSLINQPMTASTKLEFEYLQKEIKY